MIRSWARPGGFVGILGLVVAVLGSPARAEDDPAKTALALIDAHLANLDSFEQFTCRYTQTFTRAKTVEDALASRYFSEFGPPQTGKFLWARDGKKQSMKVTEDEESTRVLDNPKKTTPVPGRPNLTFGEPVPFMTEEYLTTGEHTLTYRERVKGANMWGNGKPGAWERPLFGCDAGVARGCREMIAIIRDDLTAGKATCSLAREREGGRELVKLVVSYAKKYQYDYWFNPAQGCRVVRWIRQDFTPDNTFGTVSRTEYPEARACANGRWFPTRRLSMMQQKHRPDWQVFDAKVVELEVDKKPARETFEIVLVPGTRIVEDDDPKNTMWTKQPERVHVDDLARVWEMIHQKPNDPLMDTAIHPARTSAWVWWVIGGMVGVTGLGLVGWRVRAARRNGAAVPT